MTLSVANAEAQLKLKIVFHASLVAQYLAKYNTMEAALIAGVDGDFAADSVATMQQFRSTFNAFISKASIKAMLDPNIKELAKAIGAPVNGDIAGAFSRIKEYYGETPRTIKTRGITFDTSFSVSGTGNGQLIRLVKDKYGADIESVYVENKTCKCIEDQVDLGPSARHNERFRIEGQPLVANDFIREVVLTQSGLAGIGTLSTMGTESKVLKNGNLTSKNAAGTATTMFTNWTLDSVTGVAVDLTTVHIADYNKTPVSVKISAATRSLTQRLPKLKPDVPYLPLAAYNREDGSAPANTEVKIAWGSKNQTLTLGGAETGFNYFIPDRDLDLWSDNFYSDEADFVVSVPVLASGYINLTMFHFYEMIKIGGTYWAIVPGATPFQKGDNFGTIADSFAGSDSLIQRYLVFAYGEYLNHAASPDCADPTLP